MTEPTTPAAAPGCPLCGQPEATVESVAGGAGDSASSRVKCPRCGTYRISPADADTLRRERESSLPQTTFPRDQLHLVSAYLREMTIAGHGDLLLTPSSARNMAAAAPRSVPERAERLLRSLANLTDMAGTEIELDFRVDDVLSYSRQGGETAFLVNHLVAEGLLERTAGVFSIVSVTVKGWARVEELRAAAESYQQAFVAMNFDAEMDAVFRDGIAPAIRDAGYEPFIINREEHAEQIDDLILLELNRSRFVVADFTGHRPNVYFEAGYALGHGIPVIWTCHASDIEHAHFDTRQYNHIVWTEPADLRQRLWRRIKVLVG
jgi:nucleoside 2-deoxyribosyltransferase